MSYTIPTDASAIAARVQLSTLSLSTWARTKLNKKETKEVQDKHHSDAARVIVTVCDSPLLEKISKVQNAARSEHYRLTLPTIQDGMRMVPVGRQFQHAEAMKPLRGEFDALVSEFCGQYPQLRNDAPARLNGLYDAAAWPVDIRAKFGWNLRYLACPSQGEWGEWLAESAQMGQADLHERFADALRRVVDRCGQNGVLHETVFTGLRDLCDLIPDMDLSGKLADLAARAAQLAQLDAETVRHSPKTRQDCAARAASILDMLGGVK